MASSARATPKTSYWEQFYSALTCATREEADQWMQLELDRYAREFEMDEAEAWRTIVCNLAFFSGYYGADVVRTIRSQFGGFDACFESAEFSQEKRDHMNESDKAAKDSPV